MKTLLIILSVALFFQSCQQEFTIPDENNPALPAQPGCRIKTSYYLGGGGVNDSANYTYSGDKLSRIDAENTYILYFYNGNLVTSIKHFDKATSALVKLDSFHYAGNNVSRLLSYDYDSFGWGDSTLAEYNFIYNGNQLQRVTRYDSYISRAGIDTSFTHFEYTASGNVSRAFMFDAGWAPDTISYTYDATPNYFQKNNVFYMQDPFFRIHVGFEPHLAYFISRNNVRSFTIYSGTATDPVDYEVDSLKNPLSVDIGGFEYMKYRWQCR